MHYLCLSAVVIFTKGFTVNTILIRYILKALTYSNNKSISAVSWSGGKDCNLALNKCISAGYKINYLVTFGPPSPNFKAHNIDLMKAQASATNMKHIYCTIDKNTDYKTGYIQQMENLYNKYNIKNIITGDMDFVGKSKTNWIWDVCKATNRMNAILPLWKKNRSDLIQEMLSLDFHIIFTCVKAPFFTSEWIGKRLDLNALEEMKTIKDLDICGENGEYHTMVLDGPAYNQRIKINESSIELVNDIDINDKMWYLKIDKITFVDKN